MTTQNNNEHLSGESNSRENFENKWEPTTRNFYESFDSRFFKPGINYPAYIGFPANIFNRDFDEPTEQMREFYKEQLKERE